jgi:uncharacterized damage-inducible protein DinB
MSLKGTPNPDHAPQYARYYFERALAAGDDDLLAVLEQNKATVLDFIRSLPEDKAEFQYAEGKWTLKSVLAHINDTERVFQFRALNCSRRDTSPIPGFEEDHYAMNANTYGRNYEDLAQEFESIRNATISLFRYMDDRMLDFTGTANNNVISARSAGWIIVGHAIHHVGIIKERYLVESEDY